MPPTKRPNPSDALTSRSAKSTEDMANLATQSGYKNVAMNLKNLAERRRTVASKAKQVPDAK